MSFAATAAAIRTLFTTEFPIARPTVPYVLPNEQYEPVDKQEWVRLSIAEALSTQASLGNPGANLYRDAGVATVQIFVEVNEGDGLAYEIADDIAAIFRSQRIGGLLLRTPSTSPVGPDGAWYQRNVTVPFSADTFA